MLVLAVLLPIINTIQADPADRPNDFASSTIAAVVVVGAVSILRGYIVPSGIQGADVAKTSGLWT